MIDTRLVICPAIVKEADPLAVFHLHISSIDKKHLRKDGESALRMANAYAALQVA